MCCNEFCIENQEVATVQCVEETTEAQDEEKT